jgi:hypothetical protein
MAELREAMQGLQSQLQSLPRAGPSAPALPSPAASAATRSGKRGRGLGDVLLIAVGLALGAVIALVLIP